MKKITYSLYPYCLYLISSYLIPFFFSSCQKEITIDLPPLKNKIVVDGRIEPGFPPYVILAHNMAYFGHQDQNNIQNMFIHDAVIKVSNGTKTITLTEFCSKSLPDSLLAIMAEFTGVDTLLLKNINYCIYSTFDPSVFGQVGKTYSLSIVAEGKTYTSSTSILPPVPLDSLWWRLDKDDTLGFIWSHLTEPAAEGNTYRWMAKKIGKDPTFLPPFGAAFDDKFINGQSLNLSYGYYNKGDTIVVKFCAIDNPSYQFFRSMEVVTNSEGNPFAAPASVLSNIYPQKEALGVWCGYGTALDTVVCK
ncbi:MAG: DUF4249 domain-containing protein [Bacteroidetes bacterium]|nr:DUF4249 domain-containing protein [Bacteroidota bacterium]